MKLPIKNLAVLLTIVSVPPTFAQTAAPAGTRVFLANDGGIDNKTMQRAYDSVADALQKDDHLALVKTPADANLFISLKCESRSRTQNNIDVYDHIVKLVVIDPVSHQPLWSVEERGPYPAFHVGGDSWGRNFDSVAQKLAADLQRAESNGSLTLHPH